MVGLFSLMGSALTVRESNLHQNFLGSPLGPNQELVWQKERQFAHCEWPGPIGAWKEKSIDTLISINEVE